MSIGIDVVDIERMRALLVRSASFRRRFFTAAELAHCESQADPAVRFAGTLAAKEAVMKALNLTPAPAWARRIEIVRVRGAAPVAAIDKRRVAISISHDGGVAVAAAMSKEPPQPKVDVQATNSPGKR